MKPRIPLNREDIAEFCRRWQIIEFSLFGSVLRDDFRPDSDIDVLVSFSPEAEWGLFEHAAMQEELAAMFNRKVDLITRRAVEHSRNPIRRRIILESAQPYYVAR
ncbi:MAG: nucleotidyltransferase family protein [Pseudomonadota bacterium]